jgi:chemotaxis family two-component system response regulator Rcp1
MPVPDLIFLNLPEVGREVKQDPELQYILMIVLSGSVEPVDISTSSRLHANLCIRKPFSFEELAAAVKTIEEFWLRTATLPQNG